MTDLIDQPDPNFGMGNNWCRFYPYRSETGAGEEFTVEVRLRNHLFRDAEVKVELKTPGDLNCTYPVRILTVGAKQQVAVPFVLKAEPGAQGRRVVTADIAINGCRLGEYAEGLVDL